MATIGDSVEFAQAMRDNAADSFQRVKDLAPGTELAAKASYLRALAYRRIGNFDGSLAELNHFLETFPSSPLYDDVLAEKGVHYVEIGRPSPQSDAIFADIAEQFPTHNAADNALTWLARMREADCHYTDALKIYERIADRYAGNRLGVHARQRILSLVPIVRTRVTRSVIEGLSISPRPSVSGAYVVDVHINSIGDNSELTAGDVIVGVHGRKVTDASSYYAAMSLHAPGTLVRLTVRESDQERDVTVVVSASDHYPGAEAKSTCTD